jgi:dTMP kinase
VAASLGGPGLATNQANALRRELVAKAPNEVAASLNAREDEAAWELRKELYQSVPDAVVASLKYLASDQAWKLRERWLKQRGGLASAVEILPGARAAAESVVGVDEPEAWEWRKGARAQAPAAALASLAGLEGDRAWQWRDRYRDQAPKVIARTIDGMTSPSAWALRQALAPHCKEALDSIYALDGDEAWRLRVNCADLWPSAVVKSLGPLGSKVTGRDLIRRQLTLYPTDILLLKHASAIALGVFPSTRWRYRRSDVQP